MKLAVFCAVGLLLLGITVPAQAKGGFFPTYHPKPCEGDACRGDDARSGTPCTGLLCSFASAKALARPVTASEAAEMQAQAAAAPPPVAPAATASSVEPAKKKRKLASKRSKADKPQTTVDAKLDANPAR